MKRSKVAVMLSMRRKLGNEVKRRNIVPTRAIVQESASVVKISQVLREGITQHQERMEDGRICDPECCQRALKGRYASLL